MSNEFMGSIQEIINRIDGHIGLIFVDTFEEQRLVRELKDHWKEDTIEFWSATQGLHRIKTEDTAKSVRLYSFDPSKARKEGEWDSTHGILPTLRIIEKDCRTKIAEKRHKGEITIYVMRDADKFFNNPAVVRKFRDIVYLVGTAGSVIIVTGPALTTPPDLEKDSAMVRLKHPTFDEIRENLIGGRIFRIIEKNNERPRRKGDKKLDANFDVDKITRACCGLTEDEIINTASYSLILRNTLDTQVINEEKRQIINKSDILEFHNACEPLGDVGGHDKLKEWFKIQRHVMDNPEFATKFFADQPKGVLILGVQGSGKTFISLAMATDWGKGLIKLKMGKVFAGLVGESERRIRMALAQAEAVGGVLLIDELDKGLAGAGSSDKTDGGTAKRVIGSLIEWMQDPHPGLFLVATANDITQLRSNHPELFRKGRFDELWFSDVPTEEERKEIFKIHLKRRNRDPEKFNIDKLAATCHTDGSDYHFTGAEIEYAIKEAVTWKFAKSFKGSDIKIGSKDDIKTEDIAERLKRVIPITKTGKNAIEKCRSWAKNNASNVSGNPIGSKTKSTRSGGINIRDDGDLDL